MTVKRALSGPDGVQQRQKKENEQERFMNDFEGFCNSI
jgi:hypothetical protein